MNNCTFYVYYDAQSAERRKQIDDVLHRSRDGYVLKHQHLLEITLPEFVRLTVIELTGDIGLFFFAEPVGKPLRPVVFEKSVQTLLDFTGENGTALSRRVCDGLLGLGVVQPTKGNLEQWFLDTVPITHTQTCFRDRHGRRWPRAPRKVDATRSRSQ